MSLLWTYEETARELSASTRHIYRLCDRMEIERVYISPKMPRIVPESVVAYKERLRQNLPRTDCGQENNTWPKSTKESHRRTGGASSNNRRVVDLDAALNARLNQVSKRKRN